MKVGTQFKRVNEYPQCNAHYLVAFKNQQSHYLCPLGLPGPTLAALAEMLDHQDVGEALTTLVSFSAL